MCSIIVLLFLHSIIDSLFTKPANPNHAHPHMTNAALSRKSKTCHSHMRLGRDAITPLCRRVLEIVKIVAIVSTIFIMVWV